MNHLAIILIFLTLTNVAFGQSTVGLKLNGGLSQVNARLVSLSSNSKDKDYFMSSWQGGFFYSYKFNRKSIIGTELIFLKINGKQEIKTPSTDQSGNPTGEFIASNIWRNISYLGIPIYYGYEYKKMKFHVGIQTGILLKSSGREKGQAPGFPAWDNKFDELNIDRFDFGSRIGLEYNLNKKFSIEGNYYYGINNILKETSIPENVWKWKIQQLTIGLRFKLFSSIKTK